MKVALLVDDSKSARIIISRLLKGFNLDVHLADSGEAALQALTTLRPDVIFMDHMMPGLDGFETMEQIKADPATARVPVIICTGNEEPGFLEEAQSRGAVGVLGKPPTAEKIAVVLEQAQRLAEAPLPGERVEEAPEGLFVQVAPPEAPAEVPTEIEAPAPIEAVAAEVAPPEVEPEAVAAAAVAPAQIEALVRAQVEASGLVSVREVRDLVRAIQRDELNKLVLEAVTRAVDQRTASIGGDLDQNLNRLRKEILEAADNTARSEAASAAGAAVTMALDQQVGERFTRQAEEVDARFAKAQEDVTAKAVAAARGEAGNLIAQLAKTVVAQTIDPKLKKAMADMDEAVTKVQVGLQAVRDEVLGEARGARRVAEEAERRLGAEWEEKIQHLEAMLDQVVANVQIQIEDATHGTYELVVREAMQREDKRLLELRHYLESKYNLYAGIAAGVGGVALVVAVLSYFI